MRLPVGLPPLPRPSADRRGMLGPVDPLSAAASVHLRSWTARRAPHDGEHGRHATLCLIGLSHAGLSVRICLDELDVACPFVARAGPLAFTHGRRYVLRPLPFRILEDDLM